MHGWWCCRTRPQINGHSTGVQALRTEDEDEGCFQECVDFVLYKWYILRVIFSRQQWVRSGIIQEWDDETGRIYRRGP